MLKAYIVSLSLQSHVMSGGDTSYLFCNGYYADILVLDTMTLTVAFTLVSRVSSDWMNAMHVIRTPKRNGEKSFQMLSLMPGQCPPPCQTFLKSTGKY